MPLPHLARPPPASNSTPCQAAGAARASDQRLVYFSEVYWSACYNTNLWQIRYNLQKDTIATMLPILPILCLLAAPPFFHGSDDRPAWVPGPPVYQQPGSSPASAAGNPAVAAAPHAGGAVAPQAVLEAAVRSLESRRSVSAKIHQQIQLFDKQLVGRGDYLELRGGPVPLIRLEMQVQIGDQVSSLLQVCDGQTLWSYTKLADKETLTRLDAVRATAALQQAAQRPDRNPAAVLPGLGGLSKSLRAWTPISASPPPSGDNSDKRRYGDSRAAGSRPNSPGCCPNRPRPSPRASPPTSDGSPSTSPTASSSS